MELELIINNRELKYFSESLSGEGLDSLVKKIGDNNIAKVTLKGESKSFTFLRQIALLVNLLVKMKNCSLELESKSFSRVQDLIFPIYE